MVGTLDMLLSIPAASVYPASKDLLGTGTSRRGTKDGDTACSVSTHRTTLFTLRMNRSDFLTKHDAIAMLLRLDFST